MPLETNVLSWWDWRVAGWRCLGCGKRLGNGVHECPIDRVTRQSEVSADAA